MYERKEYDLPPIWLIPLWYPFSSQVPFDGMHPHAFPLTLLDRADGGPRSLLGPITNDVTKLNKRDNRVFPKRLWKQKSCCLLYSSPINWLDAPYSRFFMAHEFCNIRSQYGFRLSSLFPYQMSSSYRNLSTRLEKSMIRFCAGVGVLDGID